MAFSIKTLSRAEADFSQLYEFIAERSEDGARRWVAAFENGLDRLRINPHLCGPAPENLLFDRNLRQLVFGTKSGLKYRALFIVEEDEAVVSILRIRGPGQDLISPEDGSSPESVGAQAISARARQKGFRPSHLHRRIDPAGVRSMRR